MHIVVNHLRFGSPVPESALRALAEEALPRCREIPVFVGAHVVPVDDEHRMMVVLATDEKTSAQVSGGPGGEWVRGHLAPPMVRPPQRYVGPVLTA
jgi:hypothetical protein